MNIKNNNTFNLLDVVLIIWGRKIFVLSIVFLSTAISYLLYLGLENKSEKTFSGYVELHFNFPTSLESLNYEPEKLRYNFTSYIQQKGFVMKQSFVKITKLEKSLLDKERERLIQVTNIFLNDLLKSFKKDMEIIDEYINQNNNVQDYKKSIEKKTLLSVEIINLLIAIDKLSTKESNKYISYLNMINIGDLESVFADKLKVAMFIQSGIGIGLIIAILYIALSANFKPLRNEKK